MKQVIAITLRNNYRGPRGEEWSSDRIWLTAKQMKKIMLDQQNPDTKSKIYWVGSRVFVARDIAYAEKYDLDDPSVLMRIKQDKNNQYLFDTLERERREAGGKA